VVAPDGDLTNQDPNDVVVTGYRIKFRKEGDEKAPVQMLDYFACNVHDPYIKNCTGFLTYLTGLLPTRTYFKSASYLCHKPYFSIIRDKILGVSDVILQDDSGIAFRYFDPRLWQFEYYGAYMTPIPLFANLYQNDLAA